MAKMSPQKNIRTLRLSELLTEIRPTSENQSKPTKLRHPPLPFGSLWRFFQFLQPVTKGLARRQAFGRGHGDGVTIGAITFKAGAHEIPGRR